MINCLIGKEMSSLHFGLDIFCLFDVRAPRTGAAVEVCTQRQHLGLSLRMGRLRQAQNTTTTFLCLSNNVPYVSTPMSSYVYRDLGAGSCRLNSRGVYCTVHRKWSTYCTDDEENKEEKAKCRIHGMLMLLSGSALPSFCVGGRGGGWFNRFFL
jgi:hypothetical protein